MPGDSGVLVYSCAFYQCKSAHEAAGAAGTRRSPRPLWARDSATPRALRVARSRRHVCCLTIESSCVVPAKAGTQPPAFVGTEGLGHSAENERARRAMSAIALTQGSLLSQGRRSSGVPRIRATRWLAITVLRQTTFFANDQQGCQFAPRTAADNRSHDRYINPARHHVRVFGVGWDWHDDGIDTVERRP